MIARWPVLAFAIVMAAIPLIPGMPPFWIVLLDNIGLAALVAMGLVLLTGVGGLTSFGQAAFCGFGAYTTAVLSTAYGVSPWLALPASLIVSGVSTGGGMGPDFRRLSMFSTCSALGKPDSRTRSTATSTDSSPNCAIADSTLAMTRSPPSRRNNKLRRRCKASGMSANGAPFLKAPGFRSINGM